MRSGVAVILGVLSVVSGFAAEARATGDRCEQRSLKALARYHRCRLKVEAGVARGGDTLNAARCVSRLTRRLAQIQASTSAACLPPEDLTATLQRVDAHAAELLRVVLTGPAADAECAADELRLIGDYEHCLLKEEAKGVRRVQLPAVSRCHAKFARRWARLERRAACLRGPAVLSTLQELVNDHLPLETIAICHIDGPESFRTISVGPAELRYHLRRHSRDFIGPCEGQSLAQKMIFDLRDNLGDEFLGIGTNMLPENPDPPASEPGVSVNTDLSTSLVRTAISRPCPETPAPPVTPRGQKPDPDAFYEYVANKYFGKSSGGCDGSSSLQQIRETINANHARGASVVLTTFEIPKVYVPMSTNTLADVPDFAALWVAWLQYLHDQGVDMPQYVELANEPDVEDGGDGFVPPDAYSELVVAVHDALQALAGTAYDALAKDIGLIGPGTHVMNGAGNTAGTIRWVKGLSDAAVAALVRWSAHAWNDTDVGGLGKWQSFIATAVGRKAMPFLVTEFATVAESFPGAPLPNGCSSLHDPTYKDGCAASNSTGYGVRAVENALALANLGVAGSLFWSADDKSDEAWGLVDGKKVGDPKRPAFPALQSLIAPLTSDAGGCEVSTATPQGGWWVLKPNWDPGQEVPGAGFMSQDGAALVVSLVNSAGVSVTQPVAITGGSLKPGRYRGCAYTVSGSSAPSITVTQNSFSYTLPPQSTFTVRIVIN